jgi:hypothetical protein
MAPGGPQLWSSAELGHAFVSHADVFAVTRVGTVVEPTRFRCGGKLCAKRNSRKEQRRDRVLRFCIRPLNGAFLLLAIMDIRAHPISFSERP